MTLVKICGLTNVEDAKIAAEADADFLGFIFYEKSPRRADPEMVVQAMGLFAGEDRYQTLAGVGVFVSPTPIQVRATLTSCGLKIGQVHGLNREEMHAVYVANFGKAYPVIRPRTLDEALAGLELLNPEKDLHKTPGWCPQLLIDGYHPELQGGTGQRADLDIAREMVQRVPRLVLAGGLTPDNVADAIRVVRPWAVDVASGVEQSAGKKDHGKVRAFIQAVRDVDKEGSN
jgi:phosphoribosylanthranilate isomerase